MSRIAKIMSSQYKKSVKADQPNILFIMDETDIKIWYILVCNLDDPYKNGEYIFKLSVKDNFPDTPPSLECLTPNGLFQTGGKICVSIGEFHPESWRKSLGMNGFANIGVVNGMIVWEPLVDSGGIRIIRDEYLLSMRPKFALKSEKYNRKLYPKLMEDFDNYMESNNNLSAVVELMKRRISSNQCGAASANDGKTGLEKVMSDIKLLDTKIPKPKKE